MVDSLAQASGKLDGFNPKKKWYRHFCKRSAVALILKNSELGLQALMIKRAEREGDPWSGHMGFPGGRSENSDRNILETARRETWEEIGLKTSEHTQFLARLSDILSQPHSGGKPMVITPYLFTIDQVPQLNINHEVADVIWVPLSFLADKSNRLSMQWKRKGVNINLPCYFYQNQRIWGLSLMMLDELIKLVRR